MKMSELLAWTELCFIYLGFVNYTGKSSVWVSCYKKIVVTYVLTEKIDFKKDRFYSGCGQTQPE